MSVMYPLHNPTPETMLSLKAKPVPVSSERESRFVFFPGLTETGKEDLLLLLPDRDSEMASKWRKGYACEGEETEDVERAENAAASKCLSAITGAAADVDHRMLLPG